MEKTRWRDRQTGETMRDGVADAVDQWRDRQPRSLASGILSSWTWTHDRLLTLNRVRRALCSTFDRETLMAKFAFAARSTDNAVVAAVRGVTGRPLAEIKQHLADGTPFWESDGYRDDPEGVKRRTRALVQQLRKLGVEPIIYELDESEDFADVEPSEVRITPDVMEGLFESYEDTTATRKRIDAERYKD